MKAFEPAPHNLFTRLNTLCLRFVRDEDGAVLAMSVLVFLVLFVSSFSVYAVGESVRQRIEVQNAADAAAYSASVVQADALSRVATLNRSMAYAYVMLGRMEMDYIVDKWLEEALLLWEIDKMIAKGINDLSNRACGHGIGDWYAGQSRYVNKEAMKLNGWRWVDVIEIRSARAQAAAQQKSWGQLTLPILTLRDAIVLMNQTQEDVLIRLPGRIETAVEDVLRKNLGDTFNDHMAGSADFSYALFQAEAPMEAYTEIIPGGEEDRFLNFSDEWDNPEDAFGIGTDDWWVLDPPGGGGFLRKYEQTARLVAEWNWYGANWQLPPKGPCFIAFSNSGSGRLEAGQVIGGSSFAETTHAKPRKLKHAFFGREGAVVVGVARRLNPQLFFLYRSKGQEGIFKGLLVNEGQRFMWTASGARAGFNRNWPGANRGEYDPTYWSGDDRDNLKNNDWDAVMLPLYRIWADAFGGHYAGATAGEVLSATSGNWIPLTGGGGAPGIQSAPPGMSGGNPAWGALNGWTLH